MALFSKKNEFVIIVYINYECKLDVLDERYFLQTILTMITTCSMLLENLTLYDFSDRMYIFILFILPVGENSMSKI